MVTGKTRQLLLSQGFPSTVLDGMPRIAGLARWTPLACACCGVLGLVWGNGWYFLLLGFMTLTGGMTDRSVYDRLYNVLIMPIIGRGPIPPHGTPRRFGCTIGAMMYLLCGAGYFTHNAYLIYIPSCFIITFAAIAGLTQWCFASAIYGALFGPPDGCCGESRGVEDRT
jgi:hypothetical protein